MNRISPFRFRCLTQAALTGVFLGFATVASAQVPPVPAGHPRVYLQASDLPAIQEKLQNPAFAEAWSDVQAADDAVAKAFVYLVTGDAQAGREAVTDGLSGLRACDDARVFDQAMHWGACVYDWCYDLLTPQEKQEFVAELERIAGLHTPNYPAEIDSPAVVGHTTEGWLLTGQLPAGVAIYDETTQMYDAAAALFFERFVEVRDFYYPAHMHHQGDSYASRFAHDQAASWLFRRMGAGDVLSREQQFVPYQFIYHLRPDGQQMRSGDTYDDRGKSSSKRLISMMTGSYYEDPHLLSMADSDLFWEGPAYYRVLELLFRPQNVQPEPISDLPHTKFFAMPMGEMVARSGWALGLDSADTVVQMRIGGFFFGNHQRKDWGTFQIYHRGPLAIATGVYEGDNSPYGSEHWHNYYHQAIAHNALLIFDPAENMDRGSHTVANDGGQRWPNNGADHPADLDMLLNSDYQMGEVSAHGMGPDPDQPEYSYIAGDITRAYAEAKVSLVTRSMVTFQSADASIPTIVISFDRVTATDPQFKKTWLLHSIQEPVVSGQVATVVRDGPTYDDSGQYGGKLIVESLFPEGAALTAVGGPGHEFWVESAQTSFDVTKAGAAEPGAWRLEVSPSTSAASDLFLHVMSVMAATANAGPPATRIETQEHMGAEVGEFTALFGKTGTRVSGGTVEVSGPSPRKVLVCDLEPGPWLVTDGGAPVVAAQVPAESQCLYVELEPGSYGLEQGVADLDGGVLPDGGGGVGGSSGAGGAPSGSGAETESDGCGCKTVGRGRSGAGTVWNLVLRPFLRSEMVE